MRCEPTMLSHQGNQNNNSLGQFRTGEILRLPVTRRGVGLLGLTLILRDT